MAEKKSEDKKKRRVYSEGGRPVIVGGLPIYEDVVERYKEERGITSDKDKNESKGKEKKAARYKFYRDKNGTLKVQWVDAKTGKPIPRDKMDKYEIVSARTTLEDVRPGYVEKSSEEESPKGPKGETKDPTLQEILYPDYEPVWDTSGFSRSSRQTPSSSKGTASKPSTKGPTTGTDQGVTSGASDSEASPGEQGDTRGFTSSRVRAPTNFEAMTPGTPEYDIQRNYQARLPAIDSDEGLVAANAERNPTHPMEGKDLSQVTSNRMDYDDQARKTMAVTLAGEIDQRFTDLTSDLGKQEAYGILSTMENRQLASGQDMVSVISAPKQYSTWNTPETTNTALANYNKNPALFDGMVDSYLSDPNSNLGFTHYYNDSLVSPSWAKNIDGVNIGPHRFLSLPEVTDKIPANVGHPLTPEQQESIARDIINANVANAWTNALGPEMAQNAPNFGPTEGIDTVSSPLSSFSPDNSFAQGMQAQRSYVSQNINRENFGDTALSPNTLGYTQTFSPENQVQQSAFDASASSFSPDDSFAQGVQAQRSYVSQNINRENYGDNFMTPGFLGDPQTFSINNQIQPQEFEGLDGSPPSYTPSVDYSGFVDSITPGLDTTGVRVDRIGMFNDNVPVNNVTGVWGDPVNGIDARYTTIDTSGNFGDYVSTDARALASVSGFAQEVAEARAKSFSSISATADVSVGFAGPDVSATVSSPSDVSSTNTSSGVSPGISGDKGGPSGSSGISTGGFASFGGTSSTPGGDPGSRSSGTPGGAPGGGGSYGGGSTAGISSGPTSPSTTGGFSSPSAPSPSTSGPSTSASSPSSSPGAPGGPSGPGTPGGPY